ncbi:MAG: ribonuclease HII [Candidatus Tectomicrobia bacterium]|uniref:Ribonuclease HII n=1 Tax=Tectimicrobiota bacterium TaxID=2528274 RepID=A0A932GMD9_UNCTE|nr:ribonuclease HII [Candidatus Tectomicrobia bacterium]
MDWWAREQAARAAGFIRIAGVDEAGRGPLAGPVVAAAVHFPVPVPIPDLNDSKKLKPAAREALYERITTCGAKWGLGIVAAPEIDRINIRQATLRAMCEAVAGLEFPPDLILVDGLDRLPLPTAQETLIGGDACCASIAAASILAKVTRDRLMDEFELKFPQYGFSLHKGYPTRLHLDRLKLYGPCPIHRRTFRGVSELPLAKKAFRS